MTIILLFGAFAGGIAIAMPVALALAFACALVLLLSDRLPVTLLPQHIVAAIDSTPLLAIPLFILLGEIVSKGGVGQRLVDLCQALVGWMRGGLAQANIVASMFFGGVSGAATADTAAVGSVMIPAMKRQGYPAALSAVVTCTSSVMGNMIPPTIDLIIYGWLTNTPIDRLFVAGLFPGLLVGVCLMVVTDQICRRNGFGQKQKFSLVDLGQKAWAAIPALGIPVIIIGGILGGFLTVTESAAAAIVYGIVAAFVIDRKAAASQATSVLSGAVRTMGPVLLLIGVASVFGWILTIERVPQELSALLLSIYPTPAAFAITVIVVGLLCGFFLTPATALIILTPIFYPIAIDFGYDPIHFGLILVSSLALGHVTPPVGLTLFIGASLAEVPIDKLIKPLLPYFCALVTAVLLIAFVPQISLFLPSLMN